MDNIIATDAGIFLQSNIAGWLWDHVALICCIVQELFITSKFPGINDYIYLTFIFY